jgi:hypothetical protein
MRYATKFARMRTAYCKMVQKSFFHLLDLCILNSHVLYKEKHKNSKPLATFHLELINNIIEKLTINKCLRIVFFI